MAAQPPIRRCGWTLMEALVILAVLGTLIGLLLPAVQKARETSYRLTCSNQLRQLAIAAQGYHTDHAALPPYADTPEIPLKHTNWLTHLLPYLEYENLYQRILRQTGVLDEPTRKSRFPFLLCPADPTSGDYPNQWGKTSYLVNWYAMTDGSNGVLSRPRSFRELSDGLSNVVLFAEAYSICDQLVRIAMISTYHHNFGITQEDKPSDDPSYWPEDYTMFQVQPRMEDCHPWRTQTPHLVMHVALADSSVRSVRATISPTTWKRALKPNDGLSLGEDW